MSVCACWTTDEHNMIINNDISTITAYNNGVVYIARHIMAAI